MLDATLETGKTIKIMQFSPHIILWNNWKNEPSGNKKMYVL